LKAKEKLPKKRFNKINITFHSLKKT
jgi:hypothetical protein